MILRTTTFLLGLVAAMCIATPSRADWKVGTARVDITPAENMWMAGYAARKTPSEGTVQNLYAKALALEDEQCQRLVIVTLDLIGVPRELREWLEQQAQEAYQLPPASLLLNASHTHCGPELRRNRVPEADSEEQSAERIRKADEYMQQLESKLLALVGEALEARAPAKLDYLFAHCNVAINRRRP